MRIYGYVDIVMGFHEVGLTQMPMFHENIYSKLTLLINLDLLSLVKILWGASLVHFVVW